MSARVRWIALGVVLLLVLGVVALNWFNTNLTMSTDQERGPKTWLVQPGETLRVSADDVLLDDRFDCAGEGFTTGGQRYGDVLNAPDSLAWTAVIVDEEGNVTLRCQPGSRFNP